MAGREKFAYLFAGFLTGCLATALAGVLGVSWLYDRSKPSTEERLLVERCYQRNTTRDQFAESLKLANAKYAAPDVEGMKKQLASVREGMPIQEVLQLAGKPTFAEGSYDKSGNAFEGCYWHYVVSGHGESGHFVEDDFYTIRFDKNDRVDLKPIWETEAADETSSKSSPAPR